MEKGGTVSQPRPRARPSPSLEPGSPGPGLLLGREEGGSSLSTSSPAKPAQDREPGGGDSKVGGGQGPSTPPQTWLQETPASDPRLDPAERSHPPQPQPSGSGGPGQQGLWLRSAPQKPPELPPTLSWVLRPTPGPIWGREP